ncbi:MAG: CDP-diacylglycerol--glycerol-3-phosphate 3-phosphatidyltransferase [Clostridiales bacterium]|nr:CDP-diacylglycerol--glycerol-3-phosphate 3-phosphatidyltransferase [Clostridiales bacterium]
MKLNLPNRLTLIRAVLVPFFIAFMIYPFFGEDNILWSRLISAAIFGLAAFTDFLDGNIARKRGLVTSFGKFMDPLADKFMIFAALIAILYSGFIFPEGGIVPTAILSNVFFWMSLIIIFRELTVTSLRLVVSGDANIVIPANRWGKIKTVSQIATILVVILEPLIKVTGGVMSLASMIITAFFTLFSGYTYVKDYWKYIDPTK